MGNTVFQRALLAATFILMFFLNSQAQTWQWVAHAGGNGSNAGNPNVADEVVNGMGLDSLGNTYIAGEMYPAPWWGDTTGPDQNLPNPYGANSYMAKYDCGGNLLWRKYIGEAHGTSGTSGQIDGMVVDGAGNCYIQGGAQGSSFMLLDSAYNLTGHSPPYVAKVSPDGHLLWARFAQASGSAPINQNLDFDPEGNIVAGFIMAYPGSYAPVTYAPGYQVGIGFGVAKYTPGGDLLWARSYSTADSSFHRVAQPGSLKADGQGNIYVCGSFQDSVRIGNQIVRVSHSTYSQGFVAKFDPDLNLLWVRTAGDTLSAGFEAMAIRKDTMYLTGLFRRNTQVFGYAVHHVGTQGDNPYVVIAVDTAVTQAYWGVNPDSIYGNGGNRRYGLVADRDGNVYFSSGFRLKHKWGPYTLYGGSATNGQAELVKISPAGQVLWAQATGGHGSDYNCASALAIDGQGSLRVAGEFSYATTFGALPGIDTHGAGNTDIFVAKYGAACPQDTALISPVPPHGLVATATGRHSVDVTWQDTRYELGYVLYRSTPDSLNYALVDSLPANTTGYTDNGLDSMTTYWYYVSAYNDHGASASNQDSAVTWAGTAPDTVAKPIPLTATATGPYTIRVDWTDNSNNEDGYVVWCSNTGTGNWIVRDTLPANSVTYTDTALAPATTYWYYVEAYNATDTAHSNTDSATTLTVGIAEVQTAMQLAVYPNPTDGRFTLAISTETQETADLTITDLTGKTVQQSNVTLQAGKNTVPVDLGAQPKGIYLLQLRTEQGSATATVSLQ